MSIADKFERGEALIDEGKIDEALALYRSIENEADKPAQVRWARKHVYDLLGYCGRQNYRRAIDGYEALLADPDADERLRRWCKADIARSKVELALLRIEGALGSYRELVESRDDELVGYVKGRLDGLSDSLLALRQAAQRWSDRASEPPTLRKKTDS